MRPPFVQKISHLLPGLGLCTLVTLIALILESIELRVFGRAWLEALVLAIIVGTIVRTFWRPGRRYAGGITFTAKTLLEVAIVLLGTAVGGEAIVAAGPGLLGGIAGVVLLSILISYAIGRVMGLSDRMATLVACGNSICGNSAIAAAAPVIGANGSDVGASIAFTAVLGVVVVLCLPLLVGVLDLSSAQYGVFAGMTVYAVPQVLAATAPVSALSVQVGTLVKLVRVLMLGPVILALALKDGMGRGSRPSLGRLVPWFIIGFLATMTLRTLGLVPAVALAPIDHVADILTILAMAALGLSVDIRSIAHASFRVVSVATLSILVLALMSYGLIHMLGIA